MSHSRFDSNKKLYSFDDHDLKFSEQSEMTNGKFSLGINENENGIKDPNRLNSSPPRLKKNLGKKISK